MPRSLPQIIGAIFMGRNYSIGEKELGRGDRVEGNGRQIEQQK